MFCFLPCESSHAIACFCIFTILYCYSFLQNGANCWLSSCFLTASHTDHLLLHLQHSQCQNLAPMNSTNSCLLEADRKCLINILWPGFGCISQIVSCKHVKHTSLWCFFIAGILMKVSLSLSLSLWCGLTFKRCIFCQAKVKTSSANVLF